jgi:hypothetical protein
MKSLLLFVEGLHDSGLANGFREEEEVNDEL